MESVRCKFTCTKVEKLATQEISFFSAVTDGTPEDNTYSKYTPDGSLELTVTNEGVFGFFEPGETYYLDIAKAGS